MELVNESTVYIVDSMGDWEDVVRSARYSTTMDLKGREQDLKLLRYLWSNEHMSPFEMVEIVWHVECPIFIARQWMRHRTFSYNEFSARYSTVPSKFWIPPDVDEVEDIIETYTHAYETYEELIRDGIDKETARMVLPQGVMTYFRAKSNFRNLIHFLKLRAAEDAHPEFQRIARKMIDELWQKFPELMNVTYEWGEPVDIEFRRP